MSAARAAGSGPRRHPSDRTIESSIPSGRRFARTVRAIRRFTGSPQKYSRAVRGRRPGMQAQRPREIRARGRVRRPRRLGRDGGRHVAVVGVSA